MANLIDDSTLEQTVQSVKTYVDSKVTNLDAGIVLLNGLTGIWGGTKAEYDAIETKDNTVVYLVRN